MRQLMMQHEYVHGRCGCRRGFHSPQSIRQAAAPLHGLRAGQCPRLLKALHHVIEHHAAVLVVQQFRTQEFVECRFRLAADAADEILTIPERFSGLRDVAHHAFHAAACLCAFFVIHEMDDCDFPRPPSCICRRVTLIFANSCAAVSRLANCTLPIFASTVS